MRFIIAALLVFIATLSLATYLHKQEIKEYESYLNNSYVINGDTLIAVDYSRIKETITLSNGVEVSRKLEPLK